MNVTQTTVDYGLLSELAYLRLENFSGNYKNIEQVKDFINSDESGISDNRKETIKNILSKYTIDDFETTTSGMQAMTLIKNDGSGITVAFRGTETSGWEAIKDLDSDADMALGEEIQQMKDALTYMQKVENDYNNIAPITLTGHSLGGALAQYVA